MPLQLEILTDPTGLVGDGAVHEFGEDGGSIGRALDNDWILPDQKRYISGHHAVVDYRGGIYYLMDLSTNGVYVNDENEPIGKGNPRRLFDGDILRMGDFEMKVAIDQGESIAMPIEPDDHDFPSEIEQLVPEVTLRTGVQLLDEEEITGDDEFQSTLFGSSPKAVPDIDALLPGTDREDSVPATPTLKEEFVPPTLQPTRVDASSDELLNTFLEGLGLVREDLHPSADPAEVLRNAGEVLREFVTGINALLLSRTDLKTAFRLDQTMVLPRHNNPLKLSANVEDSIKQLLVGREGEYLGPRDAAREVCRDLLFHQDAFLDAMTSAFTDFADRFDPDELRQNFDGDIDRKPLFGFLSKSKYWQLYCDLYPVLTEKGGGRFPQMFAEEFVKAYERQIADYKRHESADPIVPLHSAPVEDNYEVDEGYEGVETDVLDDAADRAKG